MPRFLFLVPLLVPLPALSEDDSHPVIACFGDSLTAGFGVDAGLSYPDFLAKRLQERGYRYRVVNLGISGDTTTGGLARIQSVLQLKPAITILELGGNDGLRGVPLTATRSNLESIIRQLMAARSRVILAGMTLPPNYGPDYIREFEQIYVQLAAKYRLPRIPFLLAGVALNNQLMQADGIHPNAAGNEKVAATVWKTLEPLLRRR